MAVGDMPRTWNETPYSPYSENSSTTDMWTSYATGTAVYEPRTSIQAAGRLEEEIERLRLEILNLVKILHTCQGCGGAVDEYLVLCALCREGLREARKRFLADFAQMMMEEIA